jgi:hypothetical protein
MLSPWCPLINFKRASAERRPPRNRGKFVAVIGLALIAAACSSAPSVADFNSQANSTCRTYSSKLREIDLALALSSPRRTSSIESDLSADLPAVQSGVVKLESLSEPSSEEAELKKAFGSQDVQLTDLKNLQQATKQRNSSKIASTETAFEESVATLNQEYDELGMTTCGSGPLPTPST